jgi:UTP:GlnB (protein PII) uridylyltransferase
MCTGQGLNLLTAKHRAGVLEYCKRSNAFSAGARGNPYNKICPSSLEESFLPEFNRGRKRYITEEISENNNQISRIENEVTHLKTDLALKTSLVTRYQYAPQNDQTINLLANAQSQVRSLQYEISQKETLLSSLRNKNREFKLELVKLGH